MSGIKRGRQDDGVVCSGRASCLVNLICAPLVLPYRACGIYLWPCISLVVSRVLETLFRSCLRSGCCIHSDRSFPPGSAALGDIRQRAASGVRWRRLTDIETDRMAHNDAISKELVLDISPPPGTRPGAIINHFVQERKQSLRLVVPDTYIGGRLTLTLPAEPAKKAAVLVRDGIEPSDERHGASNRVAAWPAPGWKQRPCDQQLSAAP